ncbi:glycosyltransferase [Amycolatopsis sp. cg5]|uniref:glycosyltransferase n=1 Tax=Amycolatopsis sp. cg5 TaxID=3238802 RepID=UPI0035258224
MGEPGRPGNLSVIGHNRSGKTSLVRHALSLLDRSDVVVVEVNVIAHTSVFDFFRSVAKELSEGLTDVPDLASVVDRVGTAREWYDLENAVSALFKEVGRLERYVLLVLEEFDRAPLVLAHLSAFQLLRSLVSEPDYPVGLITISRRAVIDIETDAAGGSRLDGVLGQRCYVGTLSHEEASRLIEQARPVADLSGAAEVIMRVTGRQPYLLQVLCHDLVERYLENGTIDVEGARAAVRPVFQAYFDRLLQDIEADSPGRGRTTVLDVVGETQEIPYPGEVNKLVTLGILEQGSAGFRLFTDEFAEYLRAVAPPPVAQRCVALAIATEWSSRHGGLSTFNRQLCRGLAAHQAEVYCMVLDATDEEVADAKGVGVTLLRRPTVSGAPELSSLLRRPDLPEGTVPTLIIGHGRVTGSAAVVQSEDHFPGAARLHFVHMAPDEIEFHKHDRTDDAAETAETRTRIELTLGRSADRVVAVGPRLHGRYLGYLSNHDDREPIRFDPGFDLLDARPRRVPTGTPLTMLTTGRMEDSILKGLDIAAGAGGLVAGWRHEHGLCEIELVVRGIPARSADRTLAELTEWAANQKLLLVPRNFTPDGEYLTEDLLRSSLFVMPSRAEGFGLVGLEAIVAGTPVLVSEKSGLGALLKLVLGDARAAQWVVPMFGEQAKDVATWARSIERALMDPESSFARAEELRQELARRLSWADAIEALLTAVRTA